MIDRWIDHLFCLLFVLYDLQWLLSCVFCCICSTCMCFLSSSAVRAQIHRRYTDATKKIKCNADFSACPAAGGGVWVYVRRDVSRLLYVSSYG